jgi:hypothetical protein
MKKNLLSTFLAALIWTAPLQGGPVEGYRIYRASSVTEPFSQISQVAGNVLTFNDPSGVAGNCWRVTAFNSGGESQPSNNGCLANIVLGSPSLSVKP